MCVMKCLHDTFSLLVSFEALNEADFYQQLSNSIYEGYKLIALFAGKF